MQATTTAADELPRHSPAFRMRRRANWIPLGVTYAAFYMGRYNFNVVKGDLGAFYHLDKAQVGVIATAGFWTYALSVIVNGPLADRFGGRRAILVGGLGAMVMNAILGLLFLRGWATHLVLGMSILYAMNCYFQSFGAASVVKVNAAWFHVRERGVFGGIFGIMISSGYLLAFTLGGMVYGASKKFFGVPEKATAATMKAAAFAPVFLVPAALLLVMWLIDLFLVRDTPKQAGLTDIRTGDASDVEVAPTEGDGYRSTTPPKNEPLDLTYVFHKVVMHPVIRVIAVAEFCTGFVRQGLLLYFIEFLVERHGQAPGSPVQWWTGLGITLGGIAGGLLCGVLSDKLFQSRRPPVAFLFYLGQIASLVALRFMPNGASAGVMIGVSCMFIFGVHGMLSGTASMDFGGKKAAATAAGLLDGVQYLGSGLVGFGLGWLLDTYHWKIWPYALVPFSLAGAVLMLFLWNARPSRTTAH